VGAGPIERGGDLVDAGRQLLLVGQRGRVGLVGPAPGRARFGEALGGDALEGAVHRPDPGEVAARDARP
jgi:hypothetical protein